jgi:SAM-dependent methyltransferase
LGPQPLSFLEIQTQTGWGKVLQGFSAWCRPNPGWLTLDAGCGPGLLPALLAQTGCRAFGVDLDFTTLSPQRLHSELIQGTAFRLPFVAGTFDLVTACNLMFLLEEPIPALLELRRVIRRTGQFAMINPSEQMSQASAAALAAERKLQGLACHSLLHYASLAETHHRWSADELGNMLLAAHFELTETVVRVGSGLVRFSKAVPF